jgi:quinol monooxygenase YgiN
MPARTIYHYGHSNRDQRGNDMSGSHLRPAATRAKGLFLILSILALLMIMLASTASAQSTATVYAVTYIEVVPSAKDNVAALLKEWSAAARKDDGNQNLELLQGSLRPNQFVIVGAWKDQTSLDANLGAAHTKSVREKLQPHLVSPNDGRTHTGFAVGTAQTARAPGAVYVVTHVDVPPPSRADCEVLLRQLAEASRKDEGNLRFDVYQQSNRPNHFTVVEMWKDENTRDAHVVAAHTKQFREKLGPMLGALYDDRFYKALD